jgi:hypothetical protein
MDDVRPGNVRDLKLLAQTLIDGEEEKLSQLCERLKRVAPSSYSGSQCSWAGSATPTLGKDEEAAATPGKSAQGRR